MKKLQLIMLPNPIVVDADEKAQMDEYQIRLDTFRISKGSDAIDSGFKRVKIIAGIHELPSITYSDEAEKTLKERCGWVDVYELSNRLKEERRNKHAFTEEYCEGVEDGFEEGFKTAQSLNDKKFTEEDMRKAIKFSHNSGIRVKEKSVEKDFTLDNYTNTLIQSLSQPKVFDIEVEMEEILGDEGIIAVALGEPDYKPKITNNSIKITKIF